MALLEIMARNAKPKETAYKLADSAGLYLHVATTGQRVWRYKYRFDRKEKTLTIGRYPGIGLSEARETARLARAAVERGEDPSAEKQARKNPVAVPPSETFEGVSREWHADQRERWSKGHFDDIIAQLQADVFPTLGALGMNDITTPMVVATCRKIQDRGAIDMAHRARGRIEAVFGYALAGGRANSNPAAGTVKALKPLIRSGRQPAVTTLGEAREVRALVADRAASPETRAAALFLAYTAQRVSDVREATWAEFQGLDGPEPTWAIPVARMKGSLERKAAGGCHMVPLSPQAVAVLEGIRSLTGFGPLPFCSPRWPRKPLSENALCFLHQRAGLGGRHVPHGWRATFSTVMNERRPEDRYTIDLMLAHTPGNTVESAYNRSKHMARRREIACEWGEILG